eukprot:TRINITY_DN9362_c0_g2_i1.p1 TRINITY_DN9362_c0_g2~~TRINITY_DN9362_c0_g2_i1.p1  ORF type:complete len:240 (-),score=-8.68 TRINITY_DN9362_c0_g2_i1:567-1286(-)
MLYNNPTEFSYKIYNYHKLILSNNCTQFLTKQLYNSEEYYFTEVDRSFLHTYVLQFNNATTFYNLEFCKTPELKLLVFFISQSFKHTMARPPHQRGTTKISNPSGIQNNKINDHTYTISNKNCDQIKSSQIWAVVAILIFRTELAPEPNKDKIMINEFVLIILYVHLVVLCTFIQNSEKCKTRPFIGGILTVPPHMEHEVPCKTRSRFPTRQSIVKIRQYPQKQLFQNNQHFLTESREY